MRILFQEREEQREEGQMVTKRIPSCWKKMPALWIPGEK